MATRFRLPASGAPAVSPALQSYSHNAPATVRTELLTVDATTLATVAYTPDAADHVVAGDALHRQFVSRPMASGNVFTSGNTLKFAIQCLEAHANNNVQIQIWVGVYSQDGLTLRATIRTKVLEGLEIATSLTNRFLSTTLSGSYTTVANDRLVVEFSVSGTPVATSGVQGHNASLRFGSSGATGDLPEDDTTVLTTYNPWIEFATTITFAPTATGGRISFAEFESPLVTTRGRVSFAELEVPLKSTRGRISWGELEVPLKSTKGRVSFAEFEVPSFVGSPTRGRVSFTEFEFPNAPSPTRGRVSWAEFQIPLVGARGRISWAEFEVPSFSPTGATGPEDSNIRIQFASSMDFFRGRIENVRQKHIAHGCSGNCVQSQTHVLTERSERDGRDCWESVDC